MAKARVTPRRFACVPQLEFVAVVLEIKISFSIKKESEMKKLRFSDTAILWEPQ